jgi:hypothetical protein
MCDSKWQVKIICNVPKYENMPTKVKLYMFGDINRSESGHVRRHFVDCESDVVKFPPTLLLAVTY